MDELQLHLLVNHIPVIGLPIGLLLAIGGVIFKWDHVRKAGVVVYLACGLAVFAANFTGEGAEDIVEDNVSWVDHKQIHEHEEASETAMTLSGIAMALALVHLFNWPGNPAFRNIIMTAFLVVGIAASIMIGLAAHEGGKIMRPHLGSSGAMPAQGTSPQDVIHDEQGHEESDEAND